MERGKTKGKFPYGKRVSRPPSVQVLKTLPESARAQSWDLPSPPIQEVNPHVLDLISNVDPEPPSPPPPFSLGILRQNTSLGGVSRQPSVRVLKTLPESVRPKNWRDLEFTHPRSEPPSAGPQLQGRPRTPLPPSSPSPASVSPIGKIPPTRPPTTKCKICQGSK